MLEAITAPIDQPFTVRRAADAGYKFEHRPDGRVQLINPDGEPSGNFASEADAARSANFATEAIKR